jgi:hypothetical protein
MGRNLVWLSDEQWLGLNRIFRRMCAVWSEPDDRRVISEIVHVPKSGCRWCDCVESYGLPPTIHDRFVRRAHVKAHRSAAGGKGEQKQAVGRSRGGRKTKREHLGGYSASIS